MAASSPGPHADLIEHAAGIIVASRKQPHTGPGHWAGALWEAGMLVAPGSATPAPQPVVDREALLQLLDDYAVGRYVPEDLVQHREFMADAIERLLTGSAK